MRQPPSRFANLVYAWCVQRINPERLDDWEAELHELLPWQETTGEAGANLESESFMAMAAKGGG